VCNSLVLSSGQQETCSSYWSLGVTWSKQQSLTQYFGYRYANTKSLQQDLNKIGFYQWSFFFNHLKRDVVVCFVDISGFYFHHF
jgi:hypothetical protein